MCTQSPDQKKSCSLSAVYLHPCVASPSACLDRACVKFDSLPDPSHCIYAPSGPLRGLPLSLSAVLFPFVFERSSSRMPLLCHSAATLRLPLPHDPSEDDASLTFLSSLFLPSSPPLTPAPFLHFTSLPRPLAGTFLCLHLCSVPCTWHSESTLLPCTLASDPFATPASGRYLLSLTFVSFSSSRTFPLLSHGVSWKQPSLSEFLHVLSR